MFELVEVLFWLLEFVIELAIAFADARRLKIYGRPLFRYSLWSYLGLAIFGACVGFLMSLHIPRRILPSPAISGFSLIIWPLAAGLVMKWSGGWWEKKGYTPTVVATFWGGSAFAFGAALVRWRMIGR